MPQSPSEQNAMTSSEIRTDSALTGLIATAVWMFQGLRIGLAPDEVAASSVFGWAALVVAGFSLGVTVPRALPSFFNRQPEVPREQEHRVNHLVRGVLLLGFTSYLVGVAEWGPGWHLLLATGTVAGGALIAAALPKARDVVN